MNDLVDTVMEFRFSNGNVWSVHVTFSDISAKLD